LVGRRGKKKVLEDVRHKISIVVYHVIIKKETYFVKPF